MFVFGLSDIVAYTSYTSPSERTYICIWREIKKKIKTYVCEKSPSVACKTKPGGFGGKCVEEVAGNLKLSD